MIEFDNLKDSFAQLPYDEQMKEIFKKLNSLIKIINKFNLDKKLLFTIDDVESTDPIDIFSLICCLEDEIGKLLENKEVVQ